MKKILTTGSMAVAMMIAGAANAEPRSFDSLSFNQDRQQGRVASVAKDNHSARISQFRPYHLQSAQLVVETEIAVFEEVAGEASYVRPKRVDRTPF